MDHPGGVIGQTGLIIGGRRDRLSVLPHDRTPVLSPSPRDRVQRARAWPPACRAPTRLHLNQSQGEMRGSMG